MDFLLFVPSVSLLYFYRLFTKKPHSKKKKKKKKKFVCGSPNWLPILEALGQVAGLIVMKISVMLK